MNISPHEEADFPPVSPGVTILMQLRLSLEGFPSGTHRMIVHDSDDCVMPGWREEYPSHENASHVESVCPDCISTWAIDYYITLGDTPADLGL